jgi:hypothetical protein
MREMLRRIFYVATTVVVAIVFMFSSALTAWAAETMTLTFVRHGESEADTAKPGKANGATDLSDGNKAEPRETAATTRDKDVDNDPTDVVPITEATKATKESDSRATKTDTATDTDSESSQPAAA